MNVRIPSAPVCALALLLAACGGGGGDPGPTGPTDAARVQAATQTANTNPACSTSVLPEGFYWEIGDRDAARASGTVAGNNTPSPTQVIAIASSSKWVYSTYALQKRGGLLTADVPYLNFTSGYVYPLGSGNESSCSVGETVGQCAAGVSQQASAVGKFFYSAGHFQYHAANVLGLSALTASQLTTEVTGTLATTDFVYLQTNLAGALNASAQSYAAFLRRMLRGDYRMSTQLGSNKVCASSACAAGAVFSQAPTDEAWSYSLGHWVEDDPTVGDGAFSSAGALGFYPWIDKTRTWYGVVARRAASTGNQDGQKSLRCGRLIRQAWVKGVAVTGTTPTP